MTADTRVGAHASPKFVAGLDIFIVSLCAMVAIAFAGLIFIGSWRDEYYTLAHIRDDGLSYMAQRLLGWSPRPLSECFVYLYALAVAEFNRPLIGAALAPFWIVLVAVVMLPSILARRGVLVCAVLGCLFLVGNVVAEVFYWPVGAFAYLPTLSALVLLLTLDIAGVADRPSGRVWTVVALLVAATSSEIGAFFVAIYGVLVGGIALVLRDWRSVWLLFPFLVSLGVLYFLANGRVALNQEVFGDASIVHYPARAFIASIWPFGIQTFGAYSVSSSIKDGLIGAASKLLFFLGVYFSLSGCVVEASSRRQSMRLALAAALAGSAFLMLVAAYYQFGIDCCERHGTMRQCYVFSAIGALGLFFAAWMPRQEQVGGGFCLLAAIAIPLWTTAPKIAADYRHYSRFLAARSDTWISAGTESTSSVVTQTAPGKIVGGVEVAAGTYSLADPHGNSFAQWMLQFFRKQTATFEKK